MCRSRSRSRIRILVVEDDDDIREVIGEILRELGFTILTAANGREALERLQEGDDAAHMILLDLMMPVMDGPSFRAEQIKDPRLAEIPVVVVSANDEADQMARRLGADGFLRKPLSIEDLLKVVRRSVGLPLTCSSSEERYAPSAPYAPM